MRIRQKDGFKWGYNSVIELNGKHSDMMMDYGILRLNPGHIFDDDTRLEKVYLLLQGQVTVECAGQTYQVRRESFLDDAFWLIDVPEHESVRITGRAEDSEIAVIRTVNSNQFPVKVHDLSNSVIETRGQGTMNETGTRIVKTLLDHALAPESNIMLGEDIHYPGKWAGFPSHSHPQPEIYFYKFQPENGFGLLKLGDEGVLLEHNDTVTIAPDLVHPQVSAPGYAMYFLWIIRHLDGNPYIRPNFEQQHLWVTEPGAKYWPDV
ncbi:MAG: 5-deoxyglucuronate isomerase [Clostridia bacterium]|nr:5-deoxyglucuronate isomerase [Clostridia bacterium]